jgi:imidazolonepropionase-like amidohydrolase
MRQIVSPQEAPGTGHFAKPVLHLRKVGTLEPNKLADIVAVPGNPLQNIRLTAL